MATPPESRVRYLARPEVETNQALISFWNLRRGDKSLPLRTSFREMNFPDTLKSRFVIFDVVDRGKAFKTRLHGDWLTKRTGDMTGRLLSDYPAAALRSWEPSLRNVVKDKKPVITQMESGPKNSVRIESVAVPFSHQGILVDHIIVHFEFIQGS